ncbi:MAG TPA: M24 family metallopeptidase [Oligoflexus sp.]|uniref:M24 family metallopeptidase n=1 Tax=Oligoflexus sp. TaxID=1971216 RepID=UPI002D6862D2|nr:M24 family metallopeptidase [Oligoflexus sp.]HYX36707.1 M24 family metallopeptidase [Oligoflexus sp.]
MNEIDQKLATMRQILARQGMAGFLLRGTDWFAWATGGSSNTVLLAAETGVAEVLVTLRDAYILTDSIEAERFLNEEAAQPYLVWSAPWQDPFARKAFILDQTRGGLLASDRPRGVEYALPRELWLLRRELMPEEQDRYRLLCKESAEAMTDVMEAAHPEWTEYQLAAEGAAALWKRGIHPALTMAGGENRLPRYRHPVASAEKLGSRAMLVFCARRHGLYANLTRFVYFRQPDKDEEKRKLDLAQVEWVAWQASRPGVPLSKIYERIVSSYESMGYADEPSRHHQGGPTGYLAREEVASPQSSDPLGDNTALAWNPSVKGGKIEDTILIRGSQTDILTVDPRWPTFEFADRKRPDFLVKL